MPDLLTVVTVVAPLNSAGAVHQRVIDLRDVLQIRPDTRSAGPDQVLHFHDPVVGPIRVDLARARPGVVSGIVDADAGIVDDEALSRVALAHQHGGVQQLSIGLDVARGAGFGGDDRDGALHIDLGRGSPNGQLHVHRDHVIGVEQYTLLLLSIETLALDAHTIRAGNQVGNRDTRRWPQSVDAA